MVVVFILWWMCNSHFCFYFTVNSPRMSPVFTLNRAHTWVHHALWNVMLIWVFASTGLCEDINISWEMHGYSQEGEEHSNLCLIFLKCTLILRSWNLVTCLSRCWLNRKVLSPDCRPTWLINALRRSSWDKESRVVWGERKNLNNKPSLLKQVIPRFLSVWLMPFICECQIYNN